MVHSPNVSCTSECDGSNWCPCDCHGWPAAPGATPAPAGRVVFDMAEFFPNEGVGAPPAVQLTPDEEPLAGLIGVLALALFPRCEGCGAAAGIEWESARTMYSAATPLLEAFRNRDRLLCRVCAADHHEYWDEMWASYRSGLM